MTCGIYKITENETGKAYIGQSVNIERRWKTHHKRLSPDLFSYEVIMECEKIQLAFWEIAWIGSENTLHPKGFNHTIGGNGAWGSKNPEETSRRKSKAQKGRILSEEHKQNLRKSKPDSFRKKVSDLKKGNKSLTGKKFYNNGIKNIAVFEHPGEGWTAGRINFKTRKDKGLKR